MYLLIKMKVTVKNRGLAAFMYCKDAKVLSADPVKKTVTFETDKTAREWRTCYANSEYADFNSALFVINDMIFGE